MTYTIQLASEESRPNQGIIQYPQPVGTATPLGIHERQCHQPGPKLIICNDCTTAKQYHRTLQWLSHDQYPVWYFPNWETLPFDSFSPDPELCAERLEIMYHIQQQSRYTLVTSIETIMQQLPPPTFVQQHCIILNVHDTIDIPSFRSALCDAGYQIVHQVMNHGECAIRGAIIDLFPPLAKEPIRIELIDDEIFQLKHFDPDTQKSHEPFESIKILPAKEYPWSKESIEAFKQRWQTVFPKQKDCETINQVSQQLAIQGMEQYQPLFFDRMVSLIGYLPNDAEIIYSDQLHDLATANWQRINNRYEQRCGDVNRPILKPKHLYTTVDQLFHDLSQRQQICLATDISQQTPAESLAAPDHLIDLKSKKPLEALQQLNQDYRILLVFKLQSRADAFARMCKQNKMTFHMAPDWEAFCQSKHRLMITIGRCRGGCLIPKHHIAIIPENKLLKQFSHIRAEDDKNATSTAQQQAITPFSLANLNKGDPIVHSDHGIGLYQGLVSKKLGTIDEELIQINYADGDTLYIPCHQIQKIHPYSLVETITPPCIHALGSKKWQKQKENAQKRLYDVAAECLEISAKRQLVECVPLKIPTTDLKQFASEFEYELTPDQATAIEHIHGDLAKNTPMNRLVCGDVGYGKTEVAMHAAFIAACNQQQVVILTPTTLLAEQHTQTFKERFNAWPFEIACLTSFRSSTQNKVIKEQLREGKIDIIIGTHSLIQKDMAYHQLGLIIIDEEHRFGVRQKNQLKQFKSNAHVLMLTATPIPRTLSHAFSYLSDLSIISTPPQKRKTIKTCLGTFDRPTVTDAIQRELMRGGQVYFLHNRVSDIEKIKQQILSYLPDVSIEIAHGQMPKAELEHIMKDFVNQTFSVLLCTTIIESGIDIPNANTILINRVAQLGLAQLHQLRGRVGRSHHQGFAYLLTDPHQSLQGDATKRLEAITHSNSLGAGFMLANHDLEIRGAGELLGREQSGHIDHMGTAMYHELLEKTIQTLQDKESDQPPATQDCEIDLASSRLFPADYVADPHSRLVLYKRLSQAQSIREVDQIEYEIVDRFGVLPAPASNAIDACRLKLIGTQRGVKKIRISANQAMIQFSANPNIDTGQLIAMIHKAPKQYRMRDAATVIIKLDQKESAHAIEFVLKMLNNIKSK